MVRLLFVPGEPRRYADSLMPQNDPHVEEQQGGAFGDPEARASRFSLGLWFLAVAVVLSCLVTKSYIWPAHGRFGDAAIVRFYGGLLFVAIGPAMAAAGGVLVLTASKSANSRIVVCIAAFPVLVALAYVMLDILSVLFSF